MHYFFYSISILFLSMIAGSRLNDALIEKECYAKFSSLQFLNGERLNKMIGLDIFKWILVNTFISRFNPELGLSKTPSREELKKLRKKMTYSEVSHLIAFLLVLIIGFYLVAFHNKVFGLMLLTLNIIMNLYPSLLQQKNKRRIDKLL